MNEETDQKTLIQQIYDAMFTELEQERIFNPQTLEILKELASKGELGNFKAVNAALTREVTNETT